MLRTMQLNHVAIHVTDVDRSERFYRGVLRLEAMPRPNFSFPGAWFRLGVDQELHLIGDAKYPHVEQHRGNHFALLIDDVEAWHSHLQIANVEFQAPRQRPDGATQIFLADPDGHFIELCTLPPG